MSRFIIIHELYKNPSIRRKFSLQIFNFLVIFLLFFFFSKKLKFSFSFSFSEIVSDEQSRSDRQSD